VAARCSHPLSSSQTPHRTPNPAETHQPAHVERRCAPRVRTRNLKSTPRGLSLQDPIACQEIVDVSTHELRHRTLAGEAALAPTPPLQRVEGEMLLRKEVIQPHLPVRLPCYDFVPIASPTFDHSLPRVGPWASGVTDFRDVTGGVYKARERIHRSVADLRLLATPTSRGRVADPDPN